MIIFTIKVFPIMPAFKPKTYKCIQIDAQSMKTLDTAHKEKQLEHKEIYEEKIPQLNSIIESLKREYRKTKRRGGDVSLLLELRDKIKNVKREKRELLDRRDAYYLDNSKSIFEYFESKKNIASGTSTKRVLNSFFNIKSKTQEENDNKVKRNLIKTYFSNIDESHISIDDYVINTDKCTHCNIGEIIPIDFEGVYVCNHCSRQTQLLTENEKPSYKEPPKEACFYAYKRINHFREILAQFQAKETTQIQHY